MIAWSTMLTYIFYMTIFINSGFIWYIYFLSNLLVYRFRDKLKSFRFISFACTLATVVFLCFFKASDFGDRIMFLIVPIFCIGYMWIAIENRNSEEQREKIAEQNQYINILSAENERNRIGRDLHDSLGHTFAMMTLKTELALKLLEKRNYDKVQKELSELNHISHQSMSEVRQIVSNLKYRTVVEEIDELYRLFQLSNIKLTVVNKLETSQLSPVTQSTITMILKELSNNIVKHAEADSVELSLVRQGATINIEMIDNGCGFTNLDGDELHSIQGGNGGEAIAILSNKAIDVAILDVEMPILSGLDVLEWVRKYQNVKVIIVTTFKRSGYFQRAIRSNVDAYVLKDRSVADLMKNDSKSFIWG